MQLFRPNVYQSDVRGKEIGPLYHWHAKRTVISAVSDRVKRMSLIRASYHQFISWTLDRLRRCVPYSSACSESS
ncbi:hypothetical protein O3P69_000404 [Scylla paramamosain]|uniref:Uncharacterized protein n=1 Tax=Scylla paramamosain TaxID=85552 RepID=A0AAW0UT94_SCYPA